MDIFKKLISLIAASLLLTASAHAGTWTNGQQRVTNVIWKPDAKGFYVDKSTYHDPAGCGNTDPVYLVDPSLDVAEVAFLHSLIMSANEQGKTLTVFVNGCDSSLSKPMFSGLQLNN